MKIFSKFLLSHTWYRRTGEQSGLSKTEIFSLDIFCVSNSTRPNSRSTCHVLTSSRWNFKFLLISSSLRGIYSAAESKKFSFTLNQLLTFISRLFCALFIWKNVYKFIISLIFFGNPTPKREIFKFFPSTQFNVQCNRSDRSVILCRWVRSSTHKSRKKLYQKKSQIEGRVKGLLLSAWPYNISRVFAVSEFSQDSQTNWDLRMQFTQHTLHNIKFQKLFSFFTLYFLETVGAIIREKILRSIFINT